MPLVKPNALKERILIYGGEGAGKSVCSFTIAEVSQLNGHPAKFYILDTDGESAERTHLTLYPQLTNVDIRNTRNWESLEKHIQNINNTCSREDWLIVDLFCSTWEFVQEYYSEKIFGKSREAYFLDARKRKLDSGKGAKQTPGAFEGFQDWPYIKELYNSMLDNLCYSAKCNVLCVSKSVLVDTEHDDKETRNDYNRVGFKPAGQKKIGHAFHTVQYLSVCQGDYQLQTIKDRGRKHLNERLNHYAIQYLMGVCGWKVV